MKFDTNRTNKKKPKSKQKKNQNMRYYLIRAPPPPPQSCSSSSICEILPSCFRGRWCSSRRIVALLGKATFLLRLLLGFVY